MRFLRLLAVIITLSVAVQAQVGLRIPTISAGPTSGKIQWTAGTVNNGGHAVAIAASNLSLDASMVSCAAPSYATCDFLYSNNAGVVALTQTAATAIASGNTLLALIETNGSSVPTRIVSPLQSSTVGNLAASAAAGLAVPITAVNGGTGADTSGQTGFALDTSGTYTFVAGSGTTNVLRATGGSVVNMQSATANPATTGILRFANNEGLAWRDSGNANNITYLLNGSNNMVLSGATAPTDGYYFVPPEQCSFALTTGTFAANPANSGALSAPAIVRAASGNTVLQLTTTAAANTTDMVCDITPPTRLTSGKGITINTVDYMFGYQTTALTSIGTAALNSVTYGAAGAAAAGTVAAIGGIITPTAGTSHGTPGAVTTTGQCYHESLALGTPYAAVVDATRLTLQNTFIQSAAAATVMQSCGAIVKYSNINSL